MDLFKIVVIIIFVILLFSQFAHMRKTMEVNEKLKKIVQDSNIQYQDVVEVNKSLRNIRHDINKQKAIVKAMEEGEVIDVITGVEIIDRIIHFKGKEIQDKNIAFSVDAVRLSHMSMGNGALISILTNIFDNAIEACEDLDKPWIKCSILDDSDFELYMIVENSKRTDIKIDKDNIVTSKDDRELHGYGISIIKDLIYKNDGAIYIEDKGDVFSLSIRV